MTGLPVFLPDCRVAPTVGPIGILPVALVPDCPAVPAELSIAARLAPEGVKTEVVSEMTPWEACVVPLTFAADCAAAAVPS